MSKEKEFATELKDLCIKHRVASLSASFRMLIEDHSVSHNRLYTYKSKENDIDKAETSTLEILTKKNI
jgi:hypothetical protein